MKMRYGVLLLVCLAVAGCRHDPAIDALENECRWIEDQYYQLLFDYETQAAQLAACRSVEASPTREPTAADVVPGPASSTEQPGEAPPFSIAPQIDLGIPVPADRPKSTDPPVELPPSELPGPESPPSKLPGPIFQMPRQDDAADSNDLSELRQAVMAEQVDAHVTHVVLDPRQTGGCDLDGKAGDDGISVVIEPRNAAGQFVSLAGSVSMVLLDPARIGQEARIARWDFEPAEAAKCLLPSHSGRGLQFELPWPGEPPEHSKLNLYIRYVTIDGRNLQAEQEIGITLPGQLSARWTPASSSAGRDDAALAHGDPSPEKTSPIRSVLVKRRDSTSSSRNASAVDEERSRVEPAQYHRPAWSPNR